MYCFEEEAFKIKASDKLDLMIARFMASMMMHINVEKDVRSGITMMKYAVNHEDNLTNVYPPFIIAFLLATVALIVEFNVMVILSSMTDILNVTMKYVSLAAIVNIPKFYYGSLVEHKIQKLIAGGVTLKVTNYRH